MLLKLPTELIQLVLYHCETPAFFQAAQTSRRLYEIAHGSREVILHRLEQTPGLNRDNMARPTCELYATLRCWSNAQLDGAEYRADFTTYRFPKVMDGRASVFETPRESNRALIVFKNHSSVYLMKIKDGQLIREARWESPGQDLGEVEILQTAFDGDHGVYVLHRYKPFPDQDLDPNHPFVQHAQQSHPNGTVFVAYHDLDTENKTVRLSAFPDHQDYKPLALSAVGRQFAISWQNEEDHLDHAVVLYQLLDEDESSDEDVTSEDEDEDYAEGPPEQDEQEADGVKVTYAHYTSHSLMNTNDRQIPGGLGPAVKLVFNDRGFQLLYQYRAQTLYGSFRALHDIPRGRAGPQIANRCNVQYTPTLSLQFAIGIPFFATHDIGDRINGVPCHWRYLAFGTATHRVENWTVACLLKSEAFSLRRCTHDHNLERGRRFENWEVMAQLGGYQQSTTSHGSQVAASRQGTRIAVASWKTLYIWAVNPYEVLDTESSYYPLSWASPTGTPVLRPVILQLGAVCSQLRFTEEEHELIAITDRGVMHVNLNSNGPSKRVQLDVNIIDRND